MWENFPRLLAECFFFRVVCCCFDNGINPRVWEDFCSVVVAAALFFLALCCLGQAREIMHFHVFPPAKIKQKPRKINQSFHFSLLFACLGSFFRAAPQQLISNRKIFFKLKLLLALFAHRARLWIILSTAQSTFFRRFKVSFWKFQSAIPQRQWLERKMPEQGLRCNNQSFEWPIKKSSSDLEDKAKK